jgi:trehalose 6-phosphate phosphatase
VAHGGALAIVTGRALPDIDRYLAPLRLPTAALHGTVRRNLAGQLYGGADAVDFLTRTSMVRERIANWLAVHPGLLLEDKGLALAVHLRALPYEVGLLHELQGELHRELAAELPEGMELLNGDFVVEVRPRGTDKGSAVEAFLMEAPFRGRVPVYVGDDQADVNAMAVVARHRGLVVAVGHRLQARWHLSSPTAARAWLADCLKQGGSP